MKTYNQLDKERVNNIIFDYCKLIELKLEVCDFEYENYKQKLNFIDEYGYKYFLSIENIKSSMKSRSKPSIFFKNNPYTIDNIRQYIVNKNLKCKLLSIEYKGLFDKIQFVCECGKSFQTTLSEFLYHDKTTCNYCGRKVTRDVLSLNLEEVKSYIVKNSNCELITNDYVNSTEELRLKCSCGNEFTTNLRDFKQKKYKYCKDCAGKLKTLNRNKEIYKQLKYDIDLSGCKLLTLIDDFKGLSQQIDVKCKCGNEFSIRGYSFYNTMSCLVCVREKNADKRRVSKEIINDSISKINRKKGTTYFWIDGDYKNAKSKLILKDNDGYLYQTTYGILLGGKGDSRIMKFRPNNPFTIENIKLWLRSNALGYELRSDEYKFAKSLLSWRCPVGHKFFMNFDNFQQGQRCPECDATNGEAAVLNWIISKKLKYKYQYTFNNCRGNKKLLKFDFAIFDGDNKKLFFIIEYDGIMHYEVVRFYKSFEEQEKKFKLQKHYDEIKNAYCKNNIIQLCRIPYWEIKNINNILDEFYNETCN